MLSSLHAPLGAHLDRKTCQLLQRGIHKMSLPSKINNVDFNDACSNSAIVVKSEFKRKRGDEIRKSATNDAIVGMKSTWLESAICRSHTKTRFEKWSLCDLQQTIPLLQQSDLIGAGKPAFSMFAISRMW